MSEIVLLSFLGTFFAALAGLGLGLILDRVDRKRSRVAVGWAMLGTCIPLAGGCFILLGMVE